jgi:hypothetical protein
MNPEDAYRVLLADAVASGMRVDRLTPDDWTVIPFHDAFKFSLKGRSTFGFMVLGIHVMPFHLGFHRNDAIYDLLRAQIGTSALDRPCSHQAFPGNTAVCHHQAPPSRPGPAHS